MIFTFGADIKIDASLSFDEGLISGSISFNINDPLLQFKWQCSQNLQSICDLSENQNILVLNYKHYNEILLTSFKQNNNNNNSNTNSKSISENIVLVLNKDTRNATLLFNFTLNINDYNSDQSKTNIMISNYENMISIVPNSRGMKNEDLILTIQFLNDNLNYSMFSYLWTLNNLQSQNVYLNGRTQKSLRIKHDYLNVGVNNIKLQFTEINNNNNNNNNSSVSGGGSSSYNYTKNYVYIKNTSPYGGSCIVSPQIGYSLQTTFEFSCSGWISSNLPLTYNYYFTVSNVNISLTNEDLLTGKLTTVLLPVTNKIYLDVMDSTGLITTTICNVNVLQIENGNNTFNFNKLLSTINNNSQKLLAFQVYYSNLNTNTNKNKNNINDDNDDLIFSETTLDLVSDLIIGYNANSSVSISDQEIYKNINIIVASLIQINAINNSNNKYNNNNDAKTIDKMDSLIRYAVDNVEKIVSDLAQVANLVEIINNNLNNANYSQTTVQNTEKYLNKIHLNLYNNFVEGQVVSFSNNNFAFQVTKLSSSFFVSDNNNNNNSSVSNNNQLAIEDSNNNSNDSNNDNNNMLSSQNMNSCSASTVLCLNTSILKDISQNTTTSFGISSTIYKQSRMLLSNFNLSSFSLNALKLNILVESGNIDNKTAVERENIINTNSIAAKYEVNLKVPDLNSSSSFVDDDNNSYNNSRIENTVCAKYNEEYKFVDNSLCETWYDYNNNKVVCVCSGHGLTVNVVDQLISSIAKQNQFPVVNSAAMCKI